MGLLIEKGPIHGRYDLLETALGRKAANEAVHKYIGDSNILTLEIIEKIINDRAYSNDLKRLNPLERTFLGG